MAKATKYGITSLKEDFPNEEVCLDFIFDSLHSRECSCGGTYKLIKGRKQYQCSRCRFQIAPAAGTIFHKSDTPLTLWFHALWVFSNAKSGISAKEMERQLEVTYKTAWRMLKLIREALSDGDNSMKLRGEVEANSAYMGGKGKAGERYVNLKRVINDKPVVIGAVERGGAVRAEVVPAATAEWYMEFFSRNVDYENTQMYTDKAQAFTSLGKDFKRESVNHSKKEWVRGDAHVNTIESFWGHVKRSIKGVHKSVSKQHLQGYLDAYSFHWSNSHNDRRRFSVLLGTVLLASK